MKTKILFTAITLLLATTTFAQSFKETKAKAEDGDIQAQFLLLDAYSYGYTFPDGTTVEVDAQEAIKWTTIAANNGATDLQIRLGIWYLLGDEEMGIEPNCDLGLVWLSNAAEQDYEAQLLLAEIYGYFDEKFDNIYTENVYKCMKEKNMPNYDIAFMWLNNIVKKVDDDDVNVGKDLLPQAKYRLGMMYENGFGVPKNLTEAKKLYSQAAEEGNKEAAEALKKIIK